MTFDNTNIACLVSIVLIAITPLHLQTIAPRLTSQTPTSAWTYPRYSESDLTQWVLIQIT